MTRDSAVTLLRTHRELPTINETVVDGVPTFWVDEGGPFMASLMFRVGVADEILATRGITHLVEHLALSQMRDVAHQFNGSVGLDITSFWATGATEDVCEFLPRLGAALATLPLERLDLEAGVLIAEQTGRAGSSLEYLLERRFGPHGPGVAAHPEYGLLRLTGAAVQQWAHDRFTADNAVLVLNGRPPESLRLGLPRGPRHELVLPPVQPG